MDNECAAYAFSILDTCYLMQGADIGSDYIRSFTEAYDSSCRASRGEHSVSVRVSIDTLENGNGKFRPVHRSKHRYWSFDAECTDDRRVTIWPRGIATRFCPEVGTLEVTVAPSTPSPVAGESIFHALRGIALYQRNPRNGSMLHASACSIDGMAVTFTGAAGAGKTTMLTELVRRGAAVPISNDRIRVTHDARPMVTSWPSYASYCEGTLLAIPELYEASLAYERDCAYATQRWGSAMKNAFDKTSKRVYPPVWLTNALGRRYVDTAQLGLIVFGNLDTRFQGADYRFLDPTDLHDRSHLRQQLAENRFDHQEPSFLPWHKLRLPRPELDNDQFLEHLVRSPARFLELRISPDALNDLPTIIQESICATI